MTERKWRPGYPKKYQGNPNRISPARSAWARTGWGLMTLFIYPEHQELPPEAEGMKDTEIGDSIRLLLSQSNRRPVWINLTNQTEDELDAMKRLIDLSFALAKPICAERDRVARDAEAAGDDSFARNYRAVPQFVVRAGKVEPYDQGLHHGSEDPAAGGSGDIDSDGRAPDDGGLLADEEPEVSGSQDDEP